MKFIRMLSIAIVVMFAFAAIAAVVGNTESSDATSSDFSEGAYVSIEGMSQADFEKLNDPKGSITYALETVTDCLLTYDIYDYSDIAIIFDKIDYTVSKFQSVSGTKWVADKDAAYLKVTGLQVTVTLTSDISYIFDTDNDQTFDDLAKIIDYIGTSSLKTGDKIVIKIDELIFRTVSMEEKEVSEIPDVSGKYVIKSKVDKYAQQASAVANIAINGKDITLNVNERSAMKDMDTKTYLDSKYAVGSGVISTNTYGMDGYQFSTSLKAGDNTYSFTYVDEISFINSNYKRTTSDHVIAYDYKNTPDKQNYTYNDILSKVDVDNDKAAKQITDLGGKCDLSYNTALSAAENIYDSCKDTAEPSNDSFNWGVVIAIIVVLAIVAILVAVKAGVFKR